MKPLPLTIYIFTQMTKTQPLYRLNRCRGITNTGRMCRRMNRDRVQCNQHKNTPIKQKCLRSSKVPLFPMPRPLRRSDCSFHDYMYTLSECNCVSMWGVSQSSWYYRLRPMPCNHHSDANVDTSPSDHVGWQYIKRCSCRRRRPVLPPST
jgi:hypothetical protein